MEQSGSLRMYVQEFSKSCADSWLESYFRPANRKLNYIYKKETNIHTLMFSMMNLQKAAHELEKKEQFWTSFEICTLF